MSVILDKRNPNIPLYEKVPDWAGKIYLMTFKKNTGDQELKVIKVGLTSFKDAYDRLLFNDEIFQKGKEAEWVEDSMIGYFGEDDTVVNASAMLPMKKVKDLEKQILEAWGDQDLKLPKINGMSEMRKYTNQRFAIAKNIIEKNRHVGR